MKTSEKSLWLWLKNQVPNESMELRRVENSAGVGDPDVMGIIKPGKVFWLELKTAHPKENKSDTAKVFAKGYIQPSQIVWHTRWSRLGAKAFFLVGIGSDKFLIPSISAIDEIEQITYSEIQKYRINNLLDIVRAI